MNKLFKCLSTAFLGVALAVGVGVGVAQGNKSGEVSASSTITFDNIGANLPSTSSSGTTTVNNYKFNYGGCKKQSNAALLAKGSSGGTSFFSNKTAMPGDIESVKIYINSGAAGGTTYHCAFNTSECTSRYITGSTAVNITGGNNHTYSCSVSSAKYFCIALGNNNNGQVLKIEVTYTTKTVSSIEVTTSPTRTVYYVGDTLDTTGIVVTATYDDSSSDDVTKDCTFSPTTLSTVGTQTITVTHTSTKTTTFDVTVNEQRTVTSIELNGSLSKTTYYVGDKWDLTGLNIKVNWSIGEPSYVALADATSVTKNPESATDVSVNQLTVSVTYSGKETSENYDVTVLAGPIYSKTMSDMTWTGDSGKVYADSLISTSDPQQSWRLSSSEYFGSSPVTYVFGDYSSSGNGLWSKFSGSKYYSKIASAITSATYGFAMYSQDFAINKLNRVEFSWTSVSGLGGTSNAYIVVSTDGGLTWSNIANVSSLGTNTSISYIGDSYASVNNVIVGLAFTSSTNNGQLRNVTVSLYGESLGTPSWKVRAIDVSGDNNVEVGANTTFSTTINSGYEPAADGSVTWSSSDTNIATVSNVGVVAGVSVGTATITATANDGSEVFGTRNITVVSATVHVTSVVLNEHSLEMEQYGEAQLIATVNPSDATDKTVTWSSSNSDVVDVDDSGNLLAYSAGVATITVTTKDGGYTDTCAVTVNAFVGDYVKVTSENQLFEGAKVIFAAHSTGSTSYSVACGSWNNGKYYDKVSADFADDDNSVSSADALVFTVHKYGNYYAFGYVVEETEYFVSSDSTTMSQESTYSDKVAWSLDFDNSSFEMSGKSDNEIIFQYNSGSPRFKNYNSSQKSINMYIESSSATPSNSNIVDTFVNTELHMRDYNEPLGYCKDSENHYYSTAKEKFNSLSADQKSLFTTDESYEAARARLQAWAVANGETFDASGNFVTNGYNSLINFNDSNSSIIVIIVISLVSLTVVGGYFFIRRRKETH